MSRCIVVVPCYNEADRLDVASFIDFHRQNHPQQFLMVNDGSDDRTQSLLESLHGHSPERFALLRLDRNVGKAEAVRQGVCHALLSKPDYVGFWDADLATPLSAIPDFCSLLQEDPGLQMVIGSRVRLLGRTIERNPIRHYLGRVFATAASLVLGLPVYDTQCGAKIFRVSDHLHILLQVPFHSRWIFDVELLARFVSLWRPTGHTAVEHAIYEFPLMQWHDVKGSKLGATDIAKAILDLASIFQEYRLGGRGYSNLIPHADGPSTLRRSPASTGSNSVRAEAAKLRVPPIFRAK